MKRLKVIEIAYSKLSTGDVVDLYETVEDITNASNLTPVQKKDGLHYLQVERKQKDFIGMVVIKGTDDMIQVWDKECDHTFDDYTLYPYFDTPQAYEDHLKTSWVKWQSEADADDCMPYMEYIEEVHDSGISGFHFNRESLRFVKIN